MSLHCTSHPMRLAISGAGGQRLAWRGNEGLPRGTLHGLDQTPDHSATGPLPLKCACIPALADRRCFSVVLGCKGDLFATCCLCSLKMAMPGRRQIRLILDKRSNVAFVMRGILSEYCTVFRLCVYVAMSKSRVARDPSRWVR